MKIVNNNLQKIKFFVDNLEMMFYIKTVSISKFK